MAEKISRRFVIIDGVPHKVGGEDGVNCKACGGEMLSRCQHCQGMIHVNVNVHDEEYMMTKCENCG